MGAAHGGLGIDQLIRSYSAETPLFLRRRSYDCVNYLPEDEAAELTPSDSITFNLYSTFLLPTERAASAARNAADVMYIRVIGYLLYPPVTLRVLLSPLRSGHVAVSQVANVHRNSTTLAKRTSKLSLEPVSRTSLLAIHM